MKKLLRGGTVINAHGTEKADVLIDGEVIAQIAPEISRVRMMTLLMLMPT